MPKYYLQNKEGYFFTISKEWIFQFIKEEIMFLSNKNSINAYIIVNNFQDTSVRKTKIPQPNQ